LKFEPNPNEVRDTKYVNATQLRELFKQSEDPSSGITISPWFRLICERFFFNWWQDLDTVLAAKGLPSSEEADQIHRLNEFDREISEKVE
jgi:isopentenyl-diphosphate delta-isomerase